MNEPLILYIETATQICSVALAKGNKLLGIRESDKDRSHATLLTLFIREILEDSGKGITDLDAIAVSKGPGSYTGLRIGVSTVKGLAYGGNIPIIAPGTLHSLTIGALENNRVKELLVKYPGNLLLCPMLDARRMEVFNGLFNTDGSIYQQISADIIDEKSFTSQLDQYHICFYGNGSDKCRTILTHKNAHFIEEISLSARFMIPLAIKSFQNGEFEDIAYFEPFYLKEFIATVPRKKVL